MTDDTKRVVAELPRRVRHHELEVERTAHPGEPRRVVSTDHEDCLREPAPGVQRRAARERHARAV